MVPSLSGHNSYGEFKSVSRKQQQHRPLQGSSPSRIRSNLLPVPMQGFYNLRGASDSECNVPTGSTAHIATATTATTSFSEGNTTNQTPSPIPRKYKQRPSASSSSIARQSSLGSGSGSLGVKSPPSNRLLKGAQARCINKQQSLPQSIFRRQCAVDVPPRASLATPTIILSPNNSFESTVLSSSSQQQQPPPPGSGAPPVVVPSPITKAQRLRKEWSSRQPTSSVNSSIQSNGDIRSIFKGSRKNSLFDLRDAARRKFSLIPAVSFITSGEGGGGRRKKGEWTGLEWTNT